jgi:hypothetical protein
MVSEAGTGHTRLIREEHVDVVLHHGGHYYPLNIPHHGSDFTVEVWPMSRV